MRQLIFACFVMLIQFWSTSSAAQTLKAALWVTANHAPVSLARVQLANPKRIIYCDSLGHVVLDSLKVGKNELIISAMGFETERRIVEISDSARLTLVNIELTLNNKNLKEVVISGTLREVSQTKSPVLVELYSSNFFRKNPTANLFDGLQLVNGVRPQVNCNVCNTGDIHINGLEGPYTMVLIDGMPIVSSLSSVYGMSGIPSSLIERIEVVKGPASSLYGSEAIGGLINVITKKPSSAPKFSIDLFSTNWAEVNADIGFKFKLAKVANVLTGVNYYNYQVPIDKNRDNFTDITLQHRISVFQKWGFNRQHNRKMSLSARYLYEDRWGGEMNWRRHHRGGSDVYGESIYTSRSEVLGFYELPLKEKLVFSFSMNQHHQQSAYGNVLFHAQQRIFFGQMVWDKRIRKHNFLTGLAMRYTYYNDNTTAMGGNGKDVTLGHRPQRTPLPGLFVQDELALSLKSDLLLGVRVDYHQVHGMIYTPRLAYKWNLNSQSILRLNAGTGFRVVNLFSEDHAALTGARSVIVEDELNPEQSYNANINFARSFYFKKGYSVNFDFGLFYTRFINRIVADYDANPNQIRYANSDGHASGKGITLNMEWNTPFRLRGRLGATWMENLVPFEGKMQQQILTEKFNGVWQLSYLLEKLKCEVDYTGNLYSPMRLPLLGPLDPRADYSPWWSLQNIQLTYKGSSKLELYTGIKNLLNFKPPVNSIARPFDPFDKQVQYEANGQVKPTPENPYALTFDPTYVYAPNQGRRLFAGIRYQLK